MLLQDLTFYVFSYLKINFQFQDLEKAKEIFNNILDDEILNKMPQDIIEETKKTFEERLKKIDWDNQINDYPFNQSALALYLSGLQ